MTWNIAITKRRISRAVVTGIVLQFLRLAGPPLTSLLFGIGGPTGFVLTILLGILWIWYCPTLDRLL